MSNRFDDENKIDMDIKTAFASWGKYVFKCFPQEGRLRSFLSEDSLDDSEEKNVDIINNPFIDSMVDRDNLLKAVEQIAEGEKFATVVLHAKEGTDTYRISFKSICFNDDGRTVEAIGLAEQLDERLNESEMVNALGSNFNSIYYVDVDNNKMYPYRMNPSVRAMFGEVLESKPGYHEMMEKYVNAIVLEEDKLHMLSETSINNLRRQFLIKDTYQHDYRIVRDRQVQYCRAKFVNVSGVGELHKMIAGFSDISPEKQRELERIAYVDTVTGGNNYESFKKKLRDRKVSGYLISMDIHSFKIVNSICGVARGDEALKWISENIRGVVGYNDISGHINADRFVIFCADDKINNVIRKIQTINLQLIKVSESLKIPKIQPYFGVTKWEPGKKVEEAYSEANFAKNRIKERKDVLYQIYSQADTERIVEEKQMEDNFYRDLNDNRFEIWYQPKYAPKTNKLVGAEGLVRWRRGNNEIIPPSKFIPLFERNGMIKALDEYVFREVCTHQRRWLDEGKKIVPISINLSRASLYFESVVKRYHDIARRIGIYTHLVPIEITESAAVDNDEIKSIADRFHGKGFPLLVDDFGSGYSSLATLNMKCFDTLKIDKSLIGDEYLRAWQKINMFWLKCVNPEPTVRAYSMAIYPAEGDVFMLTVRIATPPFKPDRSGFMDVNPGIASSYIFTLKPGDKVIMSGPYGDFHPHFDSKKEMIWVGGGAGMAPLRAQIMHMTKTLNTRDREMHYFYGARALNEVFYLDDFLGLEKEFPNFHFHLALDRPDPAADAAGVKYTPGFVHTVMYDTYLKDHEAPEDIEYYMCGPGPMSKAVVNMLDSLGVESASIMYDNFGG